MKNFVIGYNIIGLGVTAGFLIKNKDKWLNYINTIDEEFGGGVKGKSAGLIGGIVLAAVTTVTWPFNIPGLISKEEK